MPCGTKDTLWSTEQNAKSISLSVTKKARKITAVQYNGKQIHSDMDEPSGRYAKTIVFASTSSFFQWWKIIRARNINAAKQGGYLSGDDFISGQWYFCPATVRALKAAQAMGGSSARKAERWNSYGVFLQNTVWNCFKTKKISCTRLSRRVRLFNSIIKGIDIIR